MFLTSRWALGRQCFVKMHILGSIPGLLPRHVPFGKASQVYLMPSWLRATAIDKPEWLSSVSRIWFNLWNFSLGIASFSLRIAGYSLFLRREYILLPSASLMRSGCNSFRVTIIANFHVYWPIQFLQQPYELVAIIVPLLHDISKVTQPGWEGARFWTQATWLRSQCPCLRH